jgi:hypothetical protein
VTRRLTLPELLLQDLGITKPQDIDVEAIAWDRGAKVRDRRLVSCEARIAGRGDKAIISIDENVIPTRRRFSIGHELGHWRHDRGRCVSCRSDEIGSPGRSATDPERIADEYASDLLIPRFILEPRLRGISRPSLKAIREVAGEFNVSLTAMLLKVVETNRYPMMFVCNGGGGKRWFRPSPSVSRWFPMVGLDKESFAYGLLNDGAGEQRSPSKIGADAWFEAPGCGDYEIFEESFLLPAGQVATVLILPDDMLD